MIAKWIVCQSCLSGFAAEKAFAQCSASDWLGLDHVTWETSMEWLMIGSVIITSMKQSWYTEERRALWVLRGCYDDVMRMLWHCYGDVMRMLLWCYEDVMMMLLWCYYDVMRMLWGYYDDVIMMLWWCYDDVMMKLWWCYDDVMMMLWGTPEWTCVFMLCVRLCARRRHLSFQSVIYRVF